MSLGLYFFNFIFYFILYFYFFYFIFYFCCRCCCCSVCTPTANSYFWVTQNYQDRFLHSSIHCASLSLSLYVVPETIAIYIYIFQSISFQLSYPKFFFPFFHNSLFPSSSSSFSFLPPSFYPIPSSFSSHWSYLVLPATDSIHFFFHTHTHTFLTHLSTGFFLFFPFSHFFFFFFWFLVL